ncbi:methyltransferase, TIGR04325 family [Sphingobacterium suaedae]|uniref:Methyltransferase, TIGR04325 family n=1 Tax=Sphingobacterium suaedae TaxID=1686402 RepID=A0ABW5KIM4_9SPHI
MKTNLFKRKKKSVDGLPPYGWFGRYASWEAAVAETSGYAQPTILQKTKEALCKVRDGKAVYERDSVLFSKKEYPFSIIASLLYIAAQQQNTLHVLDFGGSLGSTYFQVRDFLRPLKRLTWHIVEQSAYVDVGRQEFEDDQLKFFRTIEESMAHTGPHVILLSSVVQYLEDPHSFLSMLSTKDVPYLLFDRTAFVREGEDRLTIQRVPPEIYDASYPAWFLNEEAFLAHFSRYCVMADFSSYVVGESDLFIDGELAGYDKGFLFERR